MKKMLMGIIVGVFLCVSFFEFIHKTVEVDGSHMCGMIYDRLTNEWYPDFVYQLRVIYKIFAFPVKTVWISVSDKEIAIADGKGRSICYGNWKIQKHGYREYKKEVL